MKYVVQLDDNGYFIGMSVADESPLEPGIYHMPRGTVDADLPNIPDGHLAKWEGEWIFEPIPVSELEPEVAPVKLTYSEYRAMTYPQIEDFE
jgi:hypothetical protein